MKPRSTLFAITLTAAFAGLASLGAQAAYSSAPVDQRPAAAELAGEPVEHWMETAEPAVAQGGAAGAWGAPGTG
ncbi:MAG: hypothetical protein JSW68_02330 [Burkholderiales bacterium]|nr:MAG: hypothetical protein JSW68_02330 [Burkholderiales bacterium]